jgi:oxygen-dependent protoporphyrinogen oxidase
MKHVVILGGGISGLTAAFTLHKLMPQGLKITLYEAQKNGGGWISTIEKEGFLFERGPRAFRSSGKGRFTLDLVKQLGCERELIEASPDAQKRYLWHNGRLQRLSPLFLLRNGLLQACLKDQASQKGEREESIGEFFTRRMGKKWTDIVIDPIVTGIFGGSLHDISVQAAWPQIYAWEQAYGSILRGFFSRRSQEKTRLLSFKNGMQTLPQKLWMHLQSRIEIHTETPICSLEHLQADHIISALPAYALPSLFPDLPRIDSVTLTTINLGWRKKVLGISGFGYLIPSKEQEPILGTTFDSAVFQQQAEAQTRVCVMMRGHNAQALAIALEALERHVGIKDAPDAVDVHTAYHAVPQYAIGHRARLQSLQTPNISFVGNFLQGVGVNDCIALSTETAQNVIKILKNPQ